MELSELKKQELRPVDADFHGLQIVVNVNAVTGRHYRDAAVKIRAAITTQKADAGQKKKRKKTPRTVLEVFDGRGKETETFCDLYAGLLKGSENEPLLMSWDLTDNGEAVSCSFEELRKRHPDLLKDLYEFCLTVDRPKLQETRTIATNRTTSDNTVATTPIPDTQTDASPIM